MFAMVRHWSPDISGPGRGRALEQLFYRYCEFRHLALTERAGSRTFRSFRSASGLQHETDGVIAGGDIGVHLELKYLVGSLGKNELLIFNQKGIDFLLGLSDKERKRPIYRVLLSGNDISDEARVFAMQWGIVLVEPNIFPLLMLHQLASRIIPKISGVDVSTQDEIWKLVPKLIVPLQERIEAIGLVPQGRGHFPGEYFCRRTLETIQRRAGERYWAAIDEFAPTWIEENYIEMAAHLFLPVRAGAIVNGPALLEG